MQIFQFFIKKDVELLIQNHIPKVLFTPHSDEEESSELIHDTNEH